MSPPRKRPPAPSDPDTRPPFAGPVRQRLRRAAAFDLREQWWKLIDLWETRRAFRLTVVSLGLGVVVLGAAWFWAYPHWVRRNAFRMANQWMEAGRLRNAAEVVQGILATEPGNPEAWRLAAALARRRDNKVAAAGYSRRAAGLAPDRPEFAVEWAADALVADRAAEAERILADLPAAARAASAPAQRVLGEIARRRFQLTAARDHFTAALTLGGPLPVNELPLGTVLLQARDPAERQRGLDLLAKRTGDPVWGADAMRTLLRDALARDDRAALLRWAEKLRLHPRCTLGDVPDCLLALDRADPARFAAVLAELEVSHAANGTQAALLLDWLNQIGRFADAVRWTRTLPPALAQKSPVIVPAAEALRRAADWPALEAWLAAGEWTTDLELIRLAYAFEASRQLGQCARQAEIFQTLKNAAAANGARAFFTANLLYAWNSRTEGIALLWIAADQPGVAFESLGVLARHYQTQREADGQYRVFRRLHTLRPGDRDIANNYAFFAALVGADPGAVRRLTDDNRAAVPANPVYRATAAFVLFSNGQFRESLALIEPLASSWRQSPAVAFAYGLALARNGRQAEARPILASLEPASLTLSEVALIARSLD